MSQKGMGLYIVLLVAGLTVGCGGVSSGISAPPTAQTTSTLISLDINADYNSRNPGQHAIPAGVIASEQGHFGPLAPQAAGVLNGSGISTYRVNAAVANVYALPQPNWSVLDPNLTMLQSAGAKVLLLLEATPAWLQPRPNYCPPRGYWAGHAPPTEINAWAQIAASYVQHVETSFPGLVIGYEIWNEPDGPQFLCTPVDTEAARMAVYLQLYAAAAQAMHAQAQAQGISIRVGGPATSNPSAGLRFAAAMLTNTTTAPYVDFVSYHHYPVGGLTPQFDWNSHPWSLLQQTTDQNLGLGAAYRNISQFVRTGKQPNANATPIFVTELGDWPNGGVDCCRSDPQYAPLFNTVAVASLLNTVYEGAQAVPQNLTYFSAFSPFPQGGFCLLALAGSNCALPGLDPYPQFYAYKLMAGPKYLDLESGGFMARSVSSDHPDVVVMGFYTAKGNSLVMVNTGANTYSTLGIALNNVGFAHPTATSYLLNADNPNILQQPLHISASSSGYTASITLPPYSVFGISLTR